MAVLYPALFWAFSRVLAPLARWIRVYEFRYRTLWQVLAIVLIALSCTGRFQELEGLVSGLLAAAVAMPVVAACMGAYLSTRIRAQRSKQRALDAADDLLRAYGLAMREQSRLLEENRVSLDALAAKMDRLDSGGSHEGRDGQRGHGGHVGHDGLRLALAGLRLECDQIRYGTYSDCPALDAVLAHHLPKWEARGLQAHAAIAPLGEGHAPLAQAIDRLLCWAGDLLASHGERPGGTVELAVAKCGNLCIVDLRLPMARNANFPRRILQDILPAAGLTVLEAREGDVKSVHFMFAEE